VKGCDGADLLPHTVDVISLAQGCEDWTLLSRRSQCRLMRFVRFEVCVVVYTNIAVLWDVWLCHLVSFHMNLMFPSSGQEMDIVNFLHKSNHSLASAPQKEGQ